MCSGNLDGCQCSPEIKVTKPVPHFRVSARHELIPWAKLDGQPHHHSCFSELSVTEVKSLVLLSSIPCSFYLSADMRVWVLTKSSHVLMIHGARTNIQLWVHTSDFLICVSFNIFLIYLFRFSNIPPEDTRVHQNIRLMFKLKFTAVEDIFTLIPLKILSLALHRHPMLLAIFWLS